MKKLFPFLAVLVSLFLFCSDSNAQGNWYTFNEASVTFWYPDNWEVSSEHLLLLLMPKPGDFRINFEPIEGIDLDKIVKESIEEIKIKFPNDTIIKHKDIVVDGMNGKEIHHITSDEHVINYVFIVTPANKILKMFYVTPKAEYDKFKSDVEKIKNKIKKM